MAEQVRRRQTKEAPLTKAQKDQIRQRNMIERDKYDLANLGQYHRCYPNADPVSFSKLTLRKGQIKEVRADAPLLVYAV